MRAGNGLSMVARQRRLVPLVVLCMMVLLQLLPAAADAADAGGHGRLAWGHKRTLDADCDGRKSVCKDPASVSYSTMLSEH